MRYALPESGMLVPLKGYFVMNLTLIIDEAGNIAATNFKDRFFIKLDGLLNGSYFLYIHGFRSALVRDNDGLESFSIYDVAENGRLQRKDEWLRRVWLREFNSFVGPIENPSSVTSGFEYVKDVFAVGLVCTNGFIGGLDTPSKETAEIYDYLAERKLMRPIYSIEKYRSPI